MRPKEPFCCGSCGASVEIKDRVGKRDVCAKCDADLHTCTHCRFYNPRAHNECDENQADWVRVKDRNNYCDYFEPRGGAFGGSGAGRKDAARKSFDDLFRK